MFAGDAYEITSCTMHEVFAEVFTDYDRTEMREELIEDSRPYVEAVHDLVVRTLVLVGSVVLVYLLGLLIVHLTAPYFIKWRAVKVHPHVRRTLRPERMMFVQNAKAATVYNSKT